VATHQAVGGRPAVLSEITRSAPIRGGCCTAEIAQLLCPVEAAAARYLPAAAAAVRAVTVASRVGAVEYLTHRELGSISGAVWRYGDCRADVGGTMKTGSGKGLQNTDYETKTHF